MMMKMQTMNVPSILRNSLFLLALGATPVLAQQPAAPAKPPAVEFKQTLDHVEFQDGDTFVFLGDSITHQCLYTQYVEDFVYTRFPKTRIHFHNAGVGGDRAQDALNRFDEDVAAKKPKYVTILLGMNDGAYTRYEQSIFDTYQKGMTAILDQLSGIGAAAIPMMPTMFDSRAQLLKTGNPTELKVPYYNGVLSLYGSWLREQAYTRGLGFVDMWAPMNDLTLEQRKKDPKWTMIPDAVHPAPAGQVVMAVAVVDNILPHPPVSQIVVAEVKGKADVKATRGVAANLQKTNKGVTFDFTAESLPWVLPPDAAEGYKLTRAGHRFSNEKVTVRDLPAGDYQLKIDGNEVAKVTAGQLAFGVELEANEKTPEYQQALKVALLNKKRNDEAVRPLRGEWSQMKGQLRTLTKAKTENAPDLAEKQKAYDEWLPGFHTRIDSLIAKAKAIEDEIYQANQPVVHHYEVVAVE
jgi:lysophospholipase L1-like esterase